MLDDEIINEKWSLRSQRFLLNKGHMQLKGRDVGSVWGPKHP